MTADDLTRLRAVAEAATPGPWEADGFYVRVGHEFAIALANSRPDTSPHDAEFIATFDPPTVAALIDRVERAERERDEACDKGFNEGFEACRLATSEHVRVVEADQEALNDSMKEAAAELAALRAAVTRRPFRLATSRHHEPRSCPMTPTSEGVRMTATPTPRVAETPDDLRVGMVVALPDSQPEQEGNS